MWIVSCKYGPASAPAAKRYAGGAHPPVPIGRCAARRGGDAAVLGHAEISVRGSDHPWVSRGGIKLAHALEAFAIDVTDHVAIDVGSSTGGFTDVLLSRGGSRVYAVDSGTNQLAWKLRQDDRVIVHEQTSARILTEIHIPEPIDIIVCDASFIALSKVLDAALGLARPAPRPAGRRRWARRCRGCARRGWTQ